MATPPYQFALQAYRAAVMADSPIGYWRLGELAPAITAHDQTTSHFNGTSTSVRFGYAPSGASEPNLAASFNGTASYVDIGDRAIFHFSTANFTIEGWFKTTDASVTTRTILGKSTGFTVGDPVFQLSVSSTQGGRFECVRGINVTGGGAINDGVWHHLVGVKNSTVTALWIDAIDIGGHNATTGSVTTTGSLTIGKFSDGGGQFFPGLLDEVAIYNTALSSARISAHYLAMTAPAATGTKLTVGMGEFR